MQQPLLSKQSNSINSQPQPKTFELSPYSDLIAFQEQQANSNNQLPKVSSANVQAAVAPQGGPPRKDEDDNEINPDEIFQGLDNPLQLEDLLIKPNVFTIDDIIREVNRGELSATTSMIGTLINPGTLGIVLYNGKIQVVGPGRWICPNPRASIVTTMSLSKDEIKYETLTIVRIKRGDIGLALDNGRPVLLDEGLHVRNERTFNYLATKPVNTQYFQHGTVHIVRVPKGCYGLATENTIPKFLKEGIHATNSTVFTFHEIHSANQPYIHHGTIHIVRVPKGQVALVTDNNVPKLLEGIHYINSRAFTYHKMEDLSQQVIKHGTITRCIVRRGEIGLAWENNQPTFIEEGVCIKDSPLFVFDKTISAAQKEIALGSKKIITVFDGEVGISYLRGKLVVLKPDRHHIDSVDHIFQGFLSTQQQCLILTGNKADKRGEGILICETKDFVEIGLRADVFYQISQPEKVLIVVGRDNVANLVKETAIATLNSIIRSTTLGEVAQSKEITARSEKVHVKATDSNTPSAPLFFDKVHDEFISKLHDTFLDHYGISITNIRIESFRIMDTELATNISKQALVTAQTETQLANLTGQTEIATAQQRRDAEVARIKAEGEAIKVKTETDAKNKAIMENAKAEAEAQVIRARAEAQAIELKAEAEAKAILVKGEAEAKRAELLQSTPLAGQIQMYQMYVDMIKHSLNGVEKVIYLPADTNINPLNFFTFQQGNIPGFLPPNQQSKKE